MSLPSSSFIGGPNLSYLAVGLSVIGSSHIRKGKRCQDSYKLSSGSLSAKPWSGFAVADGHGSEAYIYSEIGSTNACQAAIMAFERLVLLVDGDVEALKSCFQDQFAKEIYNIWGGLCSRDYQSRDVVDEEGLVVDKTDSIADKSFIKKYGSTISCAFLVGDWVFLFRIGDSDIVIQSDDGTINNIFEDDPDLKGEETYSLCSSDVLSHYQHCILPLSNLSAIFLSTDGIINSYGTDDKFFGFLTETVVSQLKTYGLSVMLNWLPEQLEKLSKNGSEDDVSLIAIVLSPPAEMLYGEINLRDKQVSGNYVTDQASDEIEEIDTEGNDLGDFEDISQVVEENSTLAHEAMKAAQGAQVMENVVSEKEDLFVTEQMSEQTDPLETCKFDNEEKP